MRFGISLIMASALRASGECISFPYGIVWFIVERRWVDYSCARRTVVCLRAIVSCLCRFTCACLAEKPTLTLICILRRFGSFWRTVVPRRAEKLLSGSSSRIANLSICTGSCCCYVFESIFFTYSPSRALIASKKVHNASFESEGTLGTQLTSV